MEFVENSFDAIVSFYAIFHIPRERHPDLLMKMNKWLKDSGIILITLGTEEMEKEEADFVGSEMVWSSFSIKKNKRMVEESGFKILGSYEEKEDEHHLWVLAKKKQIKNQIGSLIRSRPFLSFYD
ncbi:hypothetical protein AKJ63_01825 [candidate division MSBL1 archaeon SCGC-AAA259D18]|uniref:Methyltransferase type 11 domain-containing protein n=1 Tax=candidate division MSBL1 archaeon SCGC-AAA259D18 TaxID=1698262 RepID=A0A133UAJ8_9EURY|nr:hypothetical protein AKJ63_01825 [candidate division MSBL1 archaeon SCGC-AAA259D18]